jgi:hypothetical protein
MVKKITKLFKPAKADISDYVELDLSQYETALEREYEGALVKVAELGSLNELTDIKREIYDGNILIVDISGIKKDRMLLDRAVKDLKRVVLDVQGDIAEIGEKDQIIITPSNIKIDRTKVISGK